MTKEELNRELVQALEEHNIARAKSLLKDIKELENVERKKIK